MSDRNMIRLLAIGVLAFGILLVIEMRAQQAYRQDSATRLLAMQARLDKLDTEMTEMQVVMADLQKHSVKHVMGRANDAVVEGFSNLMGVLRNELEQLGELMEEEAGNDPDNNGDAEADTKNPTNEAQ